MRPTAKNTKWDKRVYCIVRRTNLDCIVRSEALIDVGGGEDNAKVRPDEKVLLKQGHMYSFLDASIDSEVPTKDDKGKVISVRKMRKPRFTIERFGYYLAPKKKVDEITLSECYPITEEMFSDYDFYGDEKYDAYIEEYTEQQKRINDAKKKAAEKIKEEKIPEAVAV